MRTFETQDPLVGFDGFNPKFLARSVIHPASGDPPQGTLQGFVPSYLVPCSTKLAVLRAFTHHSK